MSLLGGIGTLTGPLIGGILVKGEEVDLAPPPVLNALGIGVFGIRGILGAFGFGILMYSSL